MTTSNCSDSLVPSVRVHQESVHFMSQVGPILPKLRAQARKLTRSHPSDADDLVQETLVRAWAHWAHFRSTGSVGAWMARILSNTFISRVRHARVVVEATTRYDLEAHLVSHARLLAARAPLELLHHDEFSDEVLLSLDSVPSHYRVVLEMVDLDGASYKEAASRLGLPLGTVMSRLHRARRHMREALSGQAHAHGPSVESGRGGHDATLDA